MADDFGTAPPFGRRSERGTTLTEVLVVLALTSLIATPLYVVLQSAFRTERNQTEQLDTEAQLERVTGLVEDDVRSGLPSVIRTGSPADELALLLVLSDGSGQRVVWSADGGELRRRAIDADSGSLISDAVFLENVSPTGPLFRYWRSSDQELPPTSVDEIANCTARVSIDLRTVSGSIETSRTVDVAHRRPNPGAASC